MKIVILDGYTLNPGDLKWDKFYELGQVTVYERTAPEEVINRCKEATAILTNKVILSEDILSSLPDVKYIGVLSTGYHVVDIEYAKEKGIVVTNIPSYSTASVAQMVFAHILNITNRVGLHASEVRSEKWSKCKDFSFHDTPQIEISNKTIGIIGLGNTGMAVATIALAFGMKVLAFTSKPQCELPQGITSLPKEQLFKQSDIVTLHCPLNSDTEKIINSDAINLMKNSAILINTARGPLVDEHALATALNNDNLYAAGLDVLSVEPPKESNPLLNAKNCFITPHIAWATVEARTRLLDLVVKNLSCYISGNIINNVAD